MTNAPIRQQWLLFMHTHTHRGELKFSMNLLYIFRRPLFATCTVHSVHCTTALLLLLSIIILLCSLRVKCCFFFLLRLSAEWVGGWGGRATIGWSCDTDTITYAAGTIVRTLCVCVGGQSLCRAPSIISLRRETNKSLNNNNNNYSDCNNYSYSNKGKAISERSIDSRLPPVANPNINHTLPNSLIYRADIPAAPAGSRHKLTIAIALCANWLTQPTFAAISAYLSQLIDDDDDDIVQVHWIDLIYMYISGDLAILLAAMLKGSDKNQCEI